MKWRRYLFSVAGSISLYCLTPVSLVQAQIASDGTLPTNVTTSDNLNFTIRGGSQVGGNLFHSFRELSVPTRGSAVFQNSTDVQNIISRVTGSSISNIDGSLKANGTANLFLLNPNGIIFGPKAELNIGGSFVASTASSLKFADGSEFSATNPSAPPLVTLNVPVGLQYGPSPGRIVNQSKVKDSTDSVDVPVGLQVLPSKTLALVGGEVALEGGTLTAPGGRIEVGSVASNSLIRLNPTNKGFDLSYEGVQNFQDIHLSQRAVIDVSDRSGLVGSGDIQVQGRRVTLTDGSQISSITRGSISAGTVEVTASESVELIGTSADDFASNLNTLTLGDGNAGDLRIKTGRLIIRDGAIVSTGSNDSTFPSSVKGRSGNLTVDASESVEVSGRSASGGPSLLTVETITNGDAGKLEITTGRLIIRDGAEVSAATYFGAGQGGTLNVAASKSVEVIGTGIGREGQLVPSTLKAASEGAGNAGDLTIATGKLTVRDGAEVTVSGMGVGAAGNLEVKANSIKLDNFGSLTAETAAGDRGSITLLTRDLQLRHGSAINTNASGAATGGNITINTDTLVALEDSDITANAVQGQGGNIQITAQGAFLSSDSEITASSQRGINGTVEIRTPDIGIGSSVTQLEGNFVAPEQVIAGSCLTRRNAQQGSFTVTGTGGLPRNPYDSIQGEYKVSDVQGLPEVAVQPTASPSPKPQASTPNPWKQGDPIQEAQGMTVTENGRIIVGTAPQLAAAQAKDLICHSPV
jgi:filamentous hemagglutinin family protein